MSDMESHINISGKMSDMESHINIYGKISVVESLINISGKNLGHGICKYFWQNIGRGIIYRYFW